MLGPEDAGLGGLVLGRADLCVSSIRSHAQVPSRSISRDQEEGDEDERIEASAGAGAGAGASAGRGGERSK